MIRGLLTFYAAHVVYRKQPYNEVCCCGQDMKSHSVWDNHSARCMKEYAVSCWVENIIGKEK